MITCDARSYVGFHSRVVFRNDWEILCLDFPGLTLWLPTLRQQPCHWFVASYRLCLLYPVCFSCHQIRGCDWLQGAGPCCLAVRCYSLFWHSLRWSIWAIWRCYCSSCNACGSSRSRCGTWNPRAVGQVNKTHMVLWILQPKDLGSLSNIVPDFLCWDLGASS